MENKCADSTKPSAFQAVRDLLKSKDQLHQQKLAGGDLAARDARLITMTHVAIALTLCLDQPEWGMVLRAELLLQVALAGRNSDCRQPLHKHLALRRYASLAPGALDVATDAIGPHSAVANHTRVQWPHLPGLAPQFDASAASHLSILPGAKSHGCSG